MGLDSSKQSPLLKEKREVEILDTVLTTRDGIYPKIFIVPILFSLEDILLLKDKLPLDG